MLPLLKANGPHNQRANELDRVSAANVFPSAFMRWFGGFLYVLSVAWSLYQTQQQLIAMRLQCCLISF